jgi:phosphoribosylformylglycinamidine synthase
LEASLEILEKINVSGVKDLGGGGLTCCISELVDSSKNGARVDLRKIPLRETGMTPYEIMLSESQERMVFVINPEDVELAQQICDKHEIVSSVIGEVIEGNNMIISDEGEEIANLPTILLADPPSIDRPISEIPEDTEKLDLKDPGVYKSLPALLSSPNIASKEWVYKQYDHEVQVRTVVKPGDDAAVLRIDEDTAIALTTDSNTIHTKLSPFDGAAGCVAEAIRNVISMGATPYAVVDCLNFGNPETPEILWQFKTAIEGMSLVAEKFDAPVISGNVSFYNETEGIKINPTPAVGVIGVEKIKNIRTMDFKNEGDKILLIGKTYDELGGSEYQRTIHNMEKGMAPRIRIEEEFANGQTVLRLIDEDENNDITAVHDVSAGGLAVALSEMVIKSGLGCDVYLKDDELDKIQLLYSESHARYLLTVKADALDDILAKIDVDVEVIGEVKGSSLLVNGHEFTFDDLDDAYHGVIEQYMA